MRANLKMGVTKCQSDIGNKAEVETRNYPHIYLLVLGFHRQRYTLIRACAHAQWAHD